MNGPAGIETVHARIADIHNRFGAPTGFAEALVRAQTVAAPAVGGNVPVSFSPRFDVPATEVGAAPVGAAPGMPGAVPAGGPTVGAWAARLPAAGRPWAGAIEKAATQAGVPPALLAALTWAESGFRADARSHAGAIGLTQLMPGTARGLGVDPYDPAQNLAGGARYLADQIRRFGSVDLALAAYNAGPGRVERAGGIPNISETRAYVPKVLGYYAQLGGAR